jgi:undecaprenyl diphosphate synthase
VKFSRLPRHVGIIPDGNRRWADIHGLARRDGYAAGVEPGLRLLDLCRKLGIEEASVYGFTKENVRRPPDQVEAFRAACVEFCLRAVRAGAALLVLGDSTSSVFPDALCPFTERRSGGEIKVNLLVNYGWQWDLSSALEAARGNGLLHFTGAQKALASGAVSRIDLVVRWGGCRRLSGFLPFQCAYADLYVVDTLWPEMELEEFLRALNWYQKQDVTLGG